MNIKAEWGKSAPLWNWRRREKDGCWVVSSWVCAGHRPELRTFPSQSMGTIDISAVHKLGSILSLLSSPRPSIQCQNMRGPQQSTEGMLRVSLEHVGTMSLAGRLAFLRAVQPIHFDGSLTRTLYRAWEYLLSVIRECPGPWESFFCV